MRINVNTVLKTESVSNNPSGVARFNMIEQQIRTWEVLDASVLDLFNRIPREKFVSETLAGLAYADMEIPIGHGQTMLAPKMEGRILQVLEIKNTETVLEIGTGSGYLTALLSLMAKSVDSVEIFEDIAQLAEQRLKASGIRNVTIDVGDAMLGWPANISYDVIVLTGSLPMMPDFILNSMATGSRIFAVIGEGTAMQAQLISKVSDSGTMQGCKREVLFETCLPALVNAPQPKRFQF